MLFAGGRSDFIEKYLESYAHWHRAGWDVTAFDWRGQGLSRGALAPENPESFDGLVAIPFALGAMGGGDVKMLGALALWLPAAALLPLIVIMSIAGGALTLAMVIRQRLARHEGRLAIPYGVAIAFAGLWLISERFLYQFG